MPTSSRWQTSGRKNRPNIKKKTQEQKTHTGGHRSAEQDSEWSQGLPKAGFQKDQSLKGDFKIKKIFFNLYWHMVAQMVKNLPVIQETQVCYLGWEDPLE